MNAQAILIATLATILIVAIASVVSRPTLRRRRADGAIEEAMSDFDRLLVPLTTLLARGRRTSLERLRNELSWVRIPIRPEVFAILPFVGAAGAGLGLFALWRLIGGDPTLTIVLACIGGGIGFLYPNILLRGRLRRRKEAITEGVLPFIAQYARISAIARDMTSTFEIMNNIAVAEEAQYAARERLDPTERRRLLRLRRDSPYASDLWIGLREMMRHAASSIWRANATYDNPDPLLAYAIFVDDPDFAAFIDARRQARANDRIVSPEQLDVMVKNLQARRVAEVQASFASLQTKAMVTMVLFNFPLLLFSVLAPAVDPLLGALGGL
jgi:hypothetical protein